MGIKLGSQFFFDVSMQELDNILGKWSHLAIWTNYNHFAVANWSDMVVCYIFTRDDLRKNDDLRSVLYGRVFANGTFKSTKDVTNWLSNNCGEYMVHCKKLSDVKAKSDEIGCNLGTAVEWLMCDMPEYKHGTIKQDKKQMIDVICVDGQFKGKRLQVKGSFSTPTTKGSYGTTNGNINE